MFGRRSLAAAAAVLVGLLAGYWHFAELLERPAPGDAATRPAEPTGGPAVIDSAPNEGARTAEREEPAETEASSEASGAGPDGPATASEETTTAAVPPTFDVLRVEADGSAVVAGRAAPGAVVRLLRGGEEIARETANGSGEFAIALAEPLPVGEHEISLDAASDGQSVASRQTGIVSVPPEGRETELLVMVEEPDQPTRLIETPQTAADAVVAAAELPVEPSQTPPQPDGSEETTAALMAPDEQTRPSEQPAAQSPAPPSPDEAADQPLVPTLAIGAIEIEGDRLYVAGAASPGARVRVYVDDAFVAEAVGGAQSEFLASARAEVGVGSHVVRADEIDASGTVTARVAVPFERMDERPMSAVAAASAPPETEAPEEAPVDVAAAAPASAPPPPASDRAVESPTTPDADAANTPPAPSTSDDPRSSPVAASAPPQNDRLSEATPTENPVVATGPAPSTEVEEEGPAVAAAQSPQAMPEEPAIADAPTAPVPPTSSAPAPAAAEPDASPATIVQQAALQPVEGRVLIRRGDNLWRISRETYGRGSRYTVIYLANGDQIRDPDLIYPGQIFRMPNDPDLD